MTRAAGLTALLILLGLGACADLAYNSPANNASVRAGSRTDAPTDASSLPLGGLPGGR